MLREVAQPDPPSYFTEPLSDHASLKVVSTKWETMRRSSNLVARRLDQYSLVVRARSLVRQRGEGTRELLLKRCEFPRDLPPRQQDHVCVPLIEGLSRCVAPLRTRRDKCSLQSTN